mgnify:CR=1 FL=1
MSEFLIFIKYIIININKNNRLWEIVAISNKSKKNSSLWDIQRKKKR